MKPHSRSFLAVLVLAALAAISRAATPTAQLDEFFPLAAAPEQHKPVFENESVLVLDVSIPAGATVPAHLHPWPAVFIPPPGETWLEILTGPRGRLVEAVRAGAATPVSKEGAQPL